MRRQGKVIFFVIVIYCFLLPSAYGFDGPLGFSSQGKIAPEFTMPKNLMLIKEEKIPLNVTVEDKKRGFLILGRNCFESNNEPLLSGTLKRNEEFEVFASLEEYEPITFVIYALEDLKRVRLSATNLINEEGQTISKFNIDIRVLGLVPRKISEKKYALLPLVLESRENVDIGKNTYKQFWLTIYVPDGTRGGAYVGKINITSEDTVCGEIKFKVNVISRKLDKPDINYGVYYNMDSRWKGFYPQNMKKDFIDIKEHSLTSVTIFNCPSVLKDSPKFKFNGPNSYFKLGLDEVMEFYLDSGLKGPIPYFGVWYGLLGEISNAFGYEEQTPEFDAIYTQAVKAIEEHRKTKGWPEFLYSPEDEPTNTEKKFQSAKHSLQLIKSVLPDRRTYMTLSGLLKGIDDGAMLDSWVDVRCYPILNEKIIKSTYLSKDELWIYNGGSESLHPILDRFFYGFYGIKSGARGIYQWVYQWPASLEATPYNEVSRGIQGWYYTYPSAEGPLPIPAWEAIREGIDDAKYFYTLKNLVKKAKETKDHAIIKEATAAQQDMEDILGHINLNLGTPQKTAHSILGYAPSWKTEILDSWRLIIIKRIQTLDKLFESQK